ncbi:hypothetical protein N2152v2_001411 [Parachlorella kessleri]
MQLGRKADAMYGNQVQVPEAKELLSAAFNAGVNLFDNAETYASGKAEEIMGQAFKELGYKRSDLVVTTKIYFGTGSKWPNATGLSRKHIIEGTKDSLKRLQMDYVDLSVARWGLRADLPCCPLLLPPRLTAAVPPSLNGAVDLLYCHRPDAETPIEETVRAMNWVIDQGWAFYWGTSEWSAEQIEEAWSIAEDLDLIGPSMEQPEYNIFHRKRVEEEYAPLYDKYGTGLTTWSPLASGVLTGKYSGGKVPEGSRFGLEGYKSLADRALKGEKAHQLDLADQLKPIAQDLGCSLAQLSLAWCVKNPHVSSVITGSTKVPQLEENMKALEYVPKLTDELMAKIDKITSAKAPPSEE